MTAAQTQQLHEIAADIGRLRRRHPDDYIVDRLAKNLEQLAQMLGPSAAQIALWTYPGDEATITEAIRVTDERFGRLRCLLGEAE